MVEAYNAAVNEMSSFRSRHINMVSTYIVAMAAKTQCGSALATRGTGGVWPLTRISWRLTVWAYPCSEVRAVSPLPCIRAALAYLLVSGSSNAFLLPCQVYSLVFNNT